ncbi:hypothetical protein SGQ44_18115 [Flavobacterium sp. Fl-77]|uniref:Uncharacterized protein n=1 Tax=Flavobacterium flavipigmentatum TaxID=2893884 RepID=A0AAJ2SFT4_9FLAO|nr:MULTISPECIES: hypothetical protein [unclassified Flavobacterium]MDX6184082.1 hypothetical protein [Flavobacterium sp. Fl-33]MDX6187676.1 hypothetical protein [Flavobacterium sp. Fl-77]UFH39194.1 hypothetical protein LNP22_02695 [Flavobacterium sp. F-70]
MKIKILLTFFIVMIASLQMNGQEHINAKMDPKYVCFLTCNCKGVGEGWYICPACKKSWKMKKK